MTYRAIKNSPRAIVTILVCIMSAVWCVSSGYSTESNNLVGACVLYLSFCVLWNHHDNLALTILFIFIFYVNYSIIVGVYWFPEIRSYGLYRQIRMSSVYGEGILSLLIFELVLYIGSDLGKKKTRIKQVYIEARPNVYIEVVCMAAYLFIFFSELEFVEGARVTSSALGEYRYIPLLFGSAYSNKSKSSRLLWTLIIGVTSAFVFFAGGRVGAFPSIIVLLLLWYPNIKPSWVLIGAPLAILFFQMIGSMRQDISLSLNSIQTAVLRASEDKFVADTFTFAYMPALATLELAQFDGFMQKISLLMDNVLYIFFGGKYGTSILSTYSRDYYTHYYGFIAPLYLNYWFRWFGPLVAGVVVQLHVRMIKSIDWQNDAQRGLQFFIAVCVIAVSPRWYTYNILQLLRMDFIMLVAWMCVGFTAKLIAPRRRRTVNNNTELRI